MPRRPLADVWGVACPTCHSLVGAPCRDLRSQTGLLFGRRTHRARAKKVKEENVPKVPPRTWQVWNGTFTTTTATASTTITIDPWYRWANPAGTTGTSTTLTYHPVQDHVWDTWQTTDHTWYNEPDVATLQRLRDEVQARQDAIQARQEAESARRLANQRKYAGAQDRALVLLDSLLSPDQRQSMAELGEVQVRGNEGGLYVIETWGDRVHGNVRCVDEHGCMLGRLCVQPATYDHVERVAMPVADAWVGQLLAIRFNEGLLRTTANWSGRRECQQQHPRVVGEPTARMREVMAA